jgi:threonine/homoserine/homoserine lactone efflux protein
MAGAMSADAILIATVADALGALMAASEMAFEMIKWLGAACPAYVGWKLLRSGNVAATTPADADAAEDAASSRAHVLFSRNFLVAVTNPKALLFISAFLPQFIDTSASLLPQYAILTLAQCLLNLLAMLIYAACAG